MKHKLLIIFLFGLITSLYAEEGWLTLERGIEALAQKRPGEALLYFQDLKELSLFPPETEYYIGKIYELEAELDLAERQYLKALSLKDQLYNPQMVYQIQYDLSDLYLKAQRIEEYDTILLEILKEDEAYFNPENKNLHQAYLRAIDEGGLDKLLFLYRLQPQFSLEAHIRLGELYYKESRYNRSVLHNAFAVIAQMTPLLNRLAQRDPDYRFTTFEEAMIAAEREGDFRQLMQDSGLYKSLYYMGASLWALQKKSLASETWSTLVNNPDAGLWGRLADRQLKALN